MPVLDLLFIRQCPICYRDMKSGAICPECHRLLMSKADMRKKTIFVNGFPIEAISLFHYDDDIVKQLLFALKKCSNADLFKFASQLYLMLANDFSGIVTNVPRSKENIRKYGYDHVKKPVKYMCRASDDLQYECLLKRRGFTREQKNLDREKRVVNVEGKFVATKKDIPENILLIDDVVTTGSTVGACVSALMNVRSDVNIKVISLAATDAYFPA